MLNAVIDESDAITVGMPCFLYTSCIGTNCTCVGNYVVKSNTDLEFAKSVKIILNATQIRSLDIVQAQQAIVALVEFDFTLMVGNKNT